MTKKKDDVKKPTSARDRSLEPGAGDEMEVQGDGGADPAQAPLIPEADMPKAVEAIPIQNERVAATYVGMGLARDKKDEKLVYLEFSFTMTKHHSDYVPEKVADAFKWLERTDNKSIVVNHIEPQTVDIFETPKEKKATLHMTGATVSSATVGMVEENGKGKTKTVIRFRFRLMVERDEDAISFGAWRDGEQFWLNMRDTQASIK